MKYLIKELMEEGNLKTPSIIGAFEKVDRKDFVPEELKDKAYLNTPLPIELRADNFPTIDGGFLCWNCSSLKSAIKFLKSVPVRAGRRRCWLIVSGGDGRGKVIAVELILRNWMVFGRKMSVNTDL